MIYWRKRKRDVGQSVRHARGGGGDEEGFLTRAGWRQGTESGEDVVGGGGADCGFGTCRGDTDAGDYDIGSAALRIVGSFAVIGVEDTAFGNGDVGVDGGLNDAFSRTRAVSLDGVRTTGGDLAGGMVGASGSAYEQYNHSQI